MRLFLLRVLIGWWCIIFIVPVVTGLGYLFGDDKATRKRYRGYMIRWFWYGDENY